MTGGLENIRPFQKPMHGGEVQRHIGQQSQIEPGAQHIGSGSGGVGSGVERRAVVPRVQLPVSRQQEQEPITKSVQAPKVLPRIADHRESNDPVDIPTQEPVGDIIEGKTINLTKPDAAEVLDPAAWSRAIEKYLPEFQGDSARAGHIMVAMERGRGEVVKLVEGTGLTVPRIELLKETDEAHLITSAVNITAGEHNVIAVSQRELEKSSLKDPDKPSKFRVGDPEDPLIFRALPEEMYELTGFEEAHHSVLAQLRESHVTHDATASNDVYHAQEHEWQALQGKAKLARARGMTESLQYYLADTLEDAGEIRKAQGLTTHEVDLLTQLPVQEQQTAAEGSTGDRFAALRGEKDINVKVDDDYVNVKPAGGDAEVAAWTSDSGRVTLYVNPYGGDGNTHNVFVEHGLAAVANNAIAHLDETASTPITELDIDWGIPVTEDPIDQNPDYTQYINARDGYLAEGLDPEEARTLAAQATWQFREIGAPKGFTTITGIREVGDPDRPTSILGTMRRRTLSTVPDDTTKTEVLDGATQEEGAMRESNGPIPMNSMRRARNQAHMISATLRHYAPGQEFSIIAFYGRRSRTGAISAG